ncbi:MAG TPA: serine hydrolase domain-containing protein [Candidatus Dormibacteraeota bacterium]|nr:serine hydrolase domain-containing protein [Candidatus Dormibacteraeota bacterium]
MVRFARCEGVLNDACGVAFTGAVARIEHRGVPVYERAFGTTRDDDAKRPVYVDTRFDFASLTKVFVATVALHLIAAGQLALDETLGGWFPQWRGLPQERITPRMLLAHTSGMQSGADYRTLLDERVETFALERPLAASPGERVIYSDLGFIVLGALIARVSGASLASAARTLFPSASLGFAPPARERLSIVATEDDGWRGRVQGTVHDEKAALMGGCAGHAGLFGTAADVAALTEIYLGAGCGRSSDPLPADLAREATQEAAFDPVLRRGLGWALKTSASNSCGERFGATSFGHTGFVGTCVWADPQRDVLGVLLTNTVYFGRGDSRALRAAFYNALVEDLEA